MSWIILIYSIIALAVSYFFRIVDYYVDAIVLFFVIPIIILILSKERIKDYGMDLGDIQKSITYAVLFSILSIIIVSIAVDKIPALKLYYQQYRISLEFIIKIVLYMIAWEFLFRGFLLFGLGKRFGFVAANCIQTFLFFLAHIGKPYLEVISTLFTGLLFGYITIRTKSVWPMIAIHLSIIITAVVFANIV